MKKKQKNLLRVFLSFTALLALLLNSAFAAVIAEGEASLTDRIAAAGEGEVIALSDHTNEAITIPAGTKITLDLHGYTLTSATADVITNNGDLTLTDTVGGGRIERTAETGDTAGIRNNSGAVLKMEAGTIEVVTTTSGVAMGIYNAGRITEISGGEILAYTPGSNYAYGISNQGGTIDLISDGYIFGGITAFNKNGNNAMAINNGSSGTITSITGGVFYGDVRTSGGGYALRNDGTVTVSGGAFRGNTPGNAIYQRGGTYTYASGYSLSQNGDGMKVVLAKSEHYVTLLDEAETPIAAYILDREGNILRKMGRVQESYTVYKNGEKVLLTADDLSQFTANTTLTVHTDDSPVYYFLGSSVTYGSNNYGNSYADFLRDDYGITVNKKAVSGTTLVDNGSSSYVARMKAQISENAPVDKLIVQLSTNDAGQNKPLGALSDSFKAEDQDTSTIIGAIEYITAYAYETWGCDVIFWTNPKYSNSNYYAMYKALFEVQEKWDIGILDFYALGTPDSSYMSDAVHPNEAGYRWMTPIAYDYLTNFVNGTESVDAARVADVIAKIEAIGNVSLETGCIERIQTARTAYAALNPMEKKAVTNAGVMKNAFDAYCKAYTAANSSLLAGFDFEGNSLAEAGGRVTAASTDSMTFVSGKESGTTAVHFDGSKNFGGAAFESDAYDPLAAAGENLTLSTWVYFDEAPANNTTLYMIKSMNVGTFGYVRLKANSSSYIVSIRQAEGSEVTLTANIKPTVGKWILLTYVQEGDIGRFFINGRQVQEKVMPRITSLCKTANGATYPYIFTVGSGNEWTADPDPSGAMDSFALYNRAFSAEEVLEAFDPTVVTEKESVLQAAANNGGKLVSIDFEDGTANDVAGRITPIVGSSVSIVDGGKDSAKAASFVSTKSKASMLRWAQDEYDPLLYSEEGATISMWVNIDSFEGTTDLFSYGFWGYRFLLERNGSDLLVSARNYNSTTSEFRVSGIDELTGGWALITVTCDADGLYTVYFNGKQAGQKTLSFSLYNVAVYGALTSDRNTTDANSNYYGCYSIGGAPYFGNYNPNGKVDNFAIYDGVLSAKEIMELYDPSITADTDKVREVDSLLAAIAAYSDGYYDKVEAARTAYDALTEYEKTCVTGAELLDKADSIYQNGLADRNDGKYVSIDFEDGTANDAAGRITPIVGDSVKLVADGHYGNSSASFTSTKSRASMLRWKQDEYDPLLYSEEGATVSMWVNFEALGSNTVIFNYGFWGYRFILVRSDDNLLISARNYDSTSSEFKVAGLADRIGAGWTLLTVTCDQNKIYTVYFNGEQVGRQALSFSLYDIAAEAATTSKRNTTDETNNYYGYYSIGGASYWSDRVNLTGCLDEFSLYNRALTAEEVYDLYNVTDPALLAASIDNAIRAVGAVDFSIQCGSRISAARSAYDAASDEVRALVTEQAALEEAEAAYTALYAGVRKVDNSTEVTAISGPGSGNESFDKMFDGSNTTKFGNGSYTTPFVWRTEQPLTAKYYSLTTGYDSGTWTGRNPVTWTLYGSNDDGATWNEIAAETDNTAMPDANAVEIMFAIASPGAYDYYKIEFPSQGDKWLQISELALYEIKVGDYSDVDAALQEIPEDLTIYSAKTVQALNDAVNAVKRDKMADEQDVIDGYAAAIRAAIAALVEPAVEMTIDISAGMVTPGAFDGEYDITWNAHLLAGEETSYETISSQVQIKDYGVYYAADAAEMDKLLAGDAKAIATMLSFDSGENIDVYTRYGFRLKNVPANRLRTAVFYLTYEYKGVSYTICSAADTASTYPAE
ncbi:MAG: LamG-like jellyroll fold domain-containing protein [Candidatus Howiella sp.]|jgi:lysophospholipase L1-like esterase